VEYDAVAWILKNYQVFVLVLVRISAILFMMPVFNSRTIAMPVKAAMSLMLSWMVAPLIQLTAETFPSTGFGFFLLVLQEVIIGLILSLFLRMVFGGLQIAGQMVGVQMGLSVANIMDPQTGVQSVIVSQFAYMIALLLFLVANGHHMVLKILFESFEILPPGELVFTKPLYEMVMIMGHEMFILSIKLMAPVMAILFFSQVALGILAKLVPQINMLIVSFSINVALGLFFFGLTLQLFWPVLSRSLDKALRLMPLALKAMGG